MRDNDDMILAGQTWCCPCWKRQSKRDQTRSRQMSSVGRVSNAEFAMRGQFQLPAVSLDFVCQSTQNKHADARSFVPLGHSTIAHRFNGGSAKLVNRSKSPKGRHNSSPIGGVNGDLSPFSVLEVDVDSNPARTRDAPEFSTIRQIGVTCCGSPCADMRRDGGRCIA